MRGTLALAGAIALAAGAVYAYVGLRIRRPDAPRELRLPLEGFAAWWIALALNIGLVSVTYFLAAFDALTLPVQLTSSVLQRALLSASMVGLMGYLWFLLAGRDRFRAIGVVYAAYFVFNVYTLFAARPVDVLVTDWRTDVRTDVPSPGWVRLVSLGLIVLPPVAGALWYFRLFFRVDDPEKRLRIALVSAAIVGWWAIAVVAGQRDALGVTPLQTVNRVLSLLSALAVLVAHAPPAWLRRRLRAGSEAARTMR